MTGTVTTAVVVVCKDCGRPLGVEDWWKNSHFRDECFVGPTKNVLFVRVVVPIA